MSVELDPQELGFRRPFNQEVSETLHLRNPTSDPIAFKVKTTAPRKYCVRPNSGRIEPGKHMEVQVLLQAMKDEPAEGTKCKDKFLVQSVAVSADKEFSNVTSIWMDVEKSAKDSIQERKIRVNFLPPLDHAAETNGLVPEEEPVGQASPGNIKFETPAATRVDSVTAVAAPPIQAPKFESDARELTSKEASKLAVEEPKTERSAPPVTMNDDLKSQLEEAKAQIQILKKQVADNEVRRRNVGGSNKSPQMAPLQQQSPSTSETGVPLQMVAGLCLLSFLLAYFFF